MMRGRWGDSIRSSRLLDAPKSSAFSVDIPPMNRAGPAANPGAGPGPRRGVARSPGPRWTWPAGMASAVLSLCASGTVLTLCSSLADRSRCLLLGQLGEHDLPVRLIGRHQLVVRACRDDPA